MGTDFGIVKKIYGKDSTISVWGAAMDREQIGKNYDTLSQPDLPLDAWFLGPQAENGEEWARLISDVFQEYVHWRRNYFPTDPRVITSELRREHGQWLDLLDDELKTVVNQLKANYPFHSPRYLAHMTSEQTLPSIIGSIAAYFYSANNVTDQAAPVTVQLELEVGRIVARMLGYNPNTTWAHLCSGGTVANLEALWAARTAQFVPLMLRGYCADNNLDFEVRTPNGEKARLRDLDEEALLSLRPSESISMAKELAKFEVKGLGRDREAVRERIATAVKQSPFNVRRAGFASVVRSLGRLPVLFVSAAAHYSVEKAANVLGYGEAAVRKIPVTKDFRMDVAALKEDIERLDSDPDHYLAGVIGIVGTTEEGAVDPIHDIAEYRYRQRELTHNASFWFHIDAAWGGYIRSLFCDAKEGGDGSHIRKQDGDRKRLNKVLHRYHRQKIRAEEKIRPLFDEELYEYYREKIGAKEKIRPVFGVNEQLIAWKDRELYRSFITMRRADSITIDPHKLGYVPYPAGLVAFKNKDIKELLKQRAQYISDTEEGVKDKDDDQKIEEIGTYVLEGSKPGAPPVGCYLAHKTIPLTRSGHGQIMKTTLLSARRLHRYLTQHQRSFKKLETELKFAPSENDATGVCPQPFTFVPLYEPDTNIVCYVAVPMRWEGRSLKPDYFPLKELNEANKSIQERLDIPQEERGKTLPYSKEFLVSRTTFAEQQYTYDSLRKILGDKLRVEREEYEDESLHVLRSVVMNPHYHVANHKTNYLFEFVKHLHRTAREVFNPGAA